METMTNGLTLERIEKAQSSEPMGRIIFALFMFFGRKVGRGGVSIDTLPVRYFLFAHFPPPPALSLFAMQSTLLGYVIEREGKVKTRTRRRREEENSALY